jgi:hypothetical protein
MINPLPPASPQMMRFRQAAQMAIDLGTATVKTGARMLTGQKWKRTAEEQAKCLEICRGCEMWDAKHGRCRKCGCIGAFAAFLEAKPCPLGKWPQGESLTPLEEQHAGDRS